MRGLVSVIIASLCKQSLISGGGNAMERFNPECDLPAGAEVDIVRILQADTLSIAAEHDTIGTISWTLHTTACTCLTSRS